MPNSILTLDMIAKELAYQVENNLVFLNTVDSSYEKEWDGAPNGYKVGDTVRIRTPAMFGSIGTTATAEVNDYVELKSSLTLAHRRNIAVAFTTLERTLSLPEFSERILKPIGMQLANEVERTCLAAAIPSIAQTGAAGTTPAALSYVAAAGQKLDEAACPVQGRNIIWNPSAQWSMAGVLGTVYNETVNKDVLREARLGRAYGFDNFMSQIIPGHLTATVTGGTCDVNGASQGVVTVTSNAIPNGTIAATAYTGTVLAGETFTVAGVYAVNPITKQSTGQLASFVVTTTATAAPITFAPGMVTSGPYQNVSTAPTSGAKVTFTYGVGGAKTFAQSLAYHKDAFTFASAPLYMPESVAATAKSRMRQGKANIRLVGYYAGSTDVETYRADILFGFTTINRSLACRIPGAGV